MRIRAAEAERTDRRPTLLTVGAVPRTSLRIDENGAVCKIKVLVRSDEFSVGTSSRFRKESSTL